jgi:hypothetical protein
MGLIPDEVMDFSVDLIFPAALWPWSCYGSGVDSASSKNEYQESSWGYRAAGVQGRYLTANCELIA